MLNAAMEICCLRLQLGPLDQASRMCHGWYNSRLQGATAVSTALPSPELAPGYQPHISSRPRSPHLRQ